MRKIQITQEFLCLMFSRISKIMFSLRLTQHNATNTYVGAEV
jgi:hypothetical protein